VGHIYTIANVVRPFGVELGFLDIVEAPGDRPKQNVIFEIRDDQFNDLMRFMLRHRRYVPW